MATPEGRNVYDVNGTVLFRVLSHEDHEQKLVVSSATSEYPGGEATAEKVGSGASENVLSGGGMSIATKYGPMAVNKIRTYGSKKPRKLLSLSAVGSTGAEEHSAVSMHLTVEKALAELFPPTPLTANPTEREAATADDTFTNVDAPQVLYQDKAKKNPWMKVASVDHTSRLDVVQLHQHLQNRCRNEHARMKGVLCPIREKIFNDGLHELTRQITVLCPERGLLLRDLNAGMAQATETYDILFDSACQYAVRKSIERDLHSHLFEGKKTLESEVRRLDNRVNELRAKHDGMMKRFEEQKVVNAQLHAEEINYLKKANTQLVTEIKRLISMENSK